MRRAAFAIGLVAALLGAACGGAAKSAGEPAPQSPAGYPQGGAASAPPSAQSYAPTPGYPAAPEPPPPGSSAAGAPSGGVSSREATLGKARSDLDVAQRELDVAAGDCVAACRALGSMDRATGHLCGLAQDRDERGRCEDAKTKVRGARDKVRTTCGTCPGGVTVDRNAPIPSPP
jgi:hypothetical protein